MSPPARPNPDPPRIGLPISKHPAVTPLLAIVMAGQAFATGNDYIDETRTCQILHPGL